MPNNLSVYACNPNPTGIDLGKHLHQIIGIHDLFHFLSLSFSYIDILAEILEIASKIFRCFRQEILTQKSIFSGLFGTRFANAIRVPKKIFAIWHEICSICHFGRSAAISAIVASCRHFRQPIGSASTNGGVP